MMCRTALLVCCASLHNAARRITPAGGAREADPCCRVTWTRCQLAEGGDEDA